MADTNVDAGTESTVVAPPAQADIDDAAEWDAAFEDFAPGLDNTTTETTTVAPEEDDLTTDTTTVVTTDTTTTETTTETAEQIAERIANETPEQKIEREKAEADAKAAADAENYDPTLREARDIAREAAAEVEAVKSDVREKMFADVPQVLQDADGDPIKSIDDVMKLVDPRTQEPFTEEAAAMWLLQAQQQFNTRLAQTEKRIDEITEVNIDIKDQADSVKYQYGELLKRDPELRDKVWTEYEKTLVKDPDTNIIIKAPVSMERFYELMLAPYQKLAESLEYQAEQTAKAEAEVKKVQTRADRSDIYGSGKPDNMDADEKEWADAAKSYFER